MPGIPRNRCGKSFALLLPGLLAVPSAAHSAPAAPVDQASAASGTSTAASGLNPFDPTKAPVIRIKVTASRLPRMATQKNDQTVITGSAIENKPGITNFSQVIASSVPGTAASKNGEIHIRGSHGQYSYYLDGAPLPANVSGSVSDLINPKDIESLRVFTGGFPAEYGGQLAAIFDVTAKTGRVGAPGGFVQELAQGYQTYQSTGELGGSAKKLSYFFSGVRDSTESDISPLTENPIHDDGNQTIGFGKFDYQAGPQDRITLDTAFNKASLDIPNTPDRQAVGQADNQQETGDFANLVWRHSHGGATTRVVYYSHASRLKYTGGPNDLIANAGDTGITPGSISLVSTFEDQTASYQGLRLDQTTPIARHHRVQFGFDIDTVSVKQNLLLNSVTAKLETDANGNPILDSSGNPVPVTDMAGNQVPVVTTMGDVGRVTGGDRSAYIQDTWTPGRFHADYGVRYDVHKADITTSQVSPRVNLYYTAGARDSFRAFYDRLFQPADIEDVKSLSSTAISSNAGQIQAFQPERDSFYQAGFTHTFGTTSLGIDAYYRDELNTIDDSPIGNTQITVPFNFAKGYTRGLELTLGGQINRQMSYYANFARSWAKAAGPLTGGIISQSNSVPGGLYIYDDHDETNTAAFGIDYEKKGTFFNADGEYGSGFPYGDINQFRVKSHVTASFGIGGNVGHSLQIAFTVNNAFNHAYVIKQSSPFTNTQWALGRQLGIKITESF